MNTQIHTHTHTHTNTNTQPFTYALRVGIDIGSTCHRVAVGLPDGKLIDEFNVEHTTIGFSQFFKRISGHETQHQLPVMVAMEGFNGLAAGRVRLMVKYAVKVGHSTASTT